MKEPIVSAKWLHENLGQPELVILHVSQEDNKAGLVSEFEEVQIKGARFFDLKNVFRNKNSALPNMLPDAEVFEEGCRKLGISNSSKIVVYDTLGIYLSPRVWWMFKAMGHESIAVLDGGLPSWVAEGYETEALERHSHEPGNFKAHFHPGMVKEVGFVVDNLEKQHALVIDARPEGRFLGLAPEPRKGLRSGHIPKSLNIPYQKVLDNGKFRSKSELTELFSSFELEDKPLVFSCGSGITACIVLLASELVLSNPTSVYDGSWTEWAQLENLPVE